MELRQWLNANLRITEQMVLGYTQHPKSSIITLYMVPSTDFASALRDLQDYDLQYEIPAKWQKAPPIDLCKVHDLSQIKLPPAYKDIAAFQKQLVYFAPILHSKIAVFLVDLVGFSIESSEDQLQLLQQLDYALDHALELSHLRSEMHVGKASTGDGYYVFPVVPTPESNVRLFRAMLMLALTCRVEKLDIRLSGTVGTSFTFYRYDSYEAEQYDASKPSITALNIIGDASNELVRIISVVQPNQLVIAEPMIRYIARQGLDGLRHFIFPSEWEKVNEDHRINIEYRQKGGGISKAEDADVHWIAYISELLYSLIGTGKSMDKGTRIWFHPQQPLRIVGKHDVEYDVYNFVGTVNLCGTVLSLGLREDMTRMFSEARFKPLVL